jgi:hypothetical protein
VGARIEIILGGDRKFGNVRTLNVGGKLENLKEMQNAVSVLGVSEVGWKVQGEIRSGDTVCYYVGDRAERDDYTVYYCGVTGLKVVILQCVIVGVAGLKVVIIQCIIVGVSGLKVVIIQCVIVG